MATRGRRRIEQRLQKLADPRTPSERRRDEESARHNREAAERIEARYRARAEVWPEGYEDLLRAREKFYEDLNAAGFDFEGQGSPDALYGNPEARQAFRRYQCENERFFNGYASCVACDACGRPGELPDGEREGACEHCGGVVGSVYGYYGRGTTLEELKAGVESARNSGSEALADKLERILLRRLRDRGE